MDIIGPGVAPVDVPTSATSSVAPEPAASATELPVTAGGGLTGALVGVILGVGDGLVVLGDGLGLGDGDALGLGLGELDGEGDVPGDELDGAGAGPGVLVLVGLAVLHGLNRAGWWLFVTPGTLPPSGVLTIPWLPPLPPFECCPPADRPRSEPAGEIT
jgi:hypothetical protein